MSGAIEFVKIKRAGGFTGFLFFGFKYLLISQKISLHLRYDTVILINVGYDRSD